MGFSEEGERVRSLLLRGISLGAKFLLLVIMGRFLPLDDIGRYGLVVATVNILSRLAGAEFYTFTNRALVTAEEPERWPIVNGLALLVGVGLIISAPVCWLLTRFMDLGIRWLLLVGILVANQVGAEAARILVAVGQPVRSYLVSALVNGVWPLMLIALWAVVPGTGTLGSIWIAWMAGAAVGSAWGVAEVLRSIRAPYHAGTPGAAWVREGLRTAGFFLAAAAGLRAIEFADRFIVHFFLGTAAVGVYTYYASFSKLTFELPSAMVLVPMFPEMVSVMQRGPRERARRTLGRLTRRSVALSMASIPVLFVGLWVATRLLDRPEIWTSPSAYAFLLLGGVAFAASQGGHHALYGVGRDRELMWITVSAAAVNLILGCALTPLVGMPGAAVGTLAAMVVLLLAKEVRGRKILRAVPGRLSAVRATTVAPTEDL